jgi:hypothetical protein
MHNPQSRKSNKDDNTNDNKDFSGDQLGIIPDDGDRECLRDVELQINSAGLPRRFITLGCSELFKSFMMVFA